MFRLAIYLHAMSHDEKQPTPTRTLAYFFMLPNVCFPLFPVVDYSTFVRTYYDRDAAGIYHTGVKWIVRGLIHLILYRYVYLHLTKDPTTLVTFNVWTELLAETGILGFVAAIVLVGIVLTRTLWARADASPAAAYGVALAAVALVGYHFDQNFLRLDFWFLMAQGLALARS